ncbi:MAG: V-type ATP synthase subunit D [Candidatus Fermentithermobacillus carboniphilus]|uniref:V-type ATP synthase subunit D n=1 Tax=Candidatus Fermentithermobacillus carboniphilus TaxID=3085328 RepID=A0AAT9LBB7_9FIRM|nr:MAG: V-type ATP synthase subunit D [Candidatus Fermentithermobacillus carboniphilus]
MEIRVNATRQELTRLKARVRMAKRGHKLLKDKRDQLMKEFLAIVHESQRLRQELEKKLSLAYKSFSLARAVLSPPALEEALMVAGGPEEVSISYRHIMNVVVPEMYITGRSPAQGSQPEEGRVMLPTYGLASTSSDLDDALAQFRGIMPLLVRLSCIERTIQLLADEIEKTRRRVNALEYVLIPELEQAVKDVEMRLEEMDRANASRLMKIKDIVRAH